jgi:hypothetical protein
MVFEKEPISKLGMVTGYTVSCFGDTVRLGCGSGIYLPVSQRGGPFEASPCDVSVCENYVTLETVLIRAGLLGFPPCSIKVKVRGRLAGSFNTTAVKPIVL